MEMNIINAEDGIGMNVQTGGGSGGTKDHSELQNLDYEHSGHTGFAANYIVELTKENDEITSNKTINEIIEAYKKDYIVKGILTDTEAGVDFNLQLLMAFEDSDFGLVQFATVYDSGDDFKSITIIGTLEDNEDSWQYLDKEIVSDSDYVHTDNNYTNAEKTKLAGLENKIITVNADPQTMQLDKSADEIEEYLNNGYIVMALGYQVFRNDYNASTHTIKLAIFFGAFGQVITVVGNQVTNVNEYFYVSDQNYVHTDNNFTYSYRNKLDTTAEVSQNNLGLVNGGQVYDAINWVVDLSSYSVGDTISDADIVAKLKDGRTVIYYDGIYYRLAAIYGTGYVFTTMSGTDHGQWITLNYNSGANTFYVYENGTANWEVPSNKVQNLNNPTTDTYPSTLAVYNALQNAGGGMYLGTLGDFTSSNRLDLTNLDKGIYFIKVPNTINWGSQYLYIKATANGIDLTANISLNNDVSVGGFLGEMLNDMLVIKIDKKIADMTITSSRQAFGMMFCTYFSYATDHHITYFHNQLQIKTNELRAGGSAITNSIKPVTIDNDSTITGTLTFSTLPEIDSSLTPTTDYQLVNKKYVDDNAGGGSSEIVQIYPHYFSTLDIADVQKIIDKLNEHPDIQQTYILTQTGGTGVDITPARLDNKLSTSTTVYTLQIYKFATYTNTQRIQYVYQPYTVVISWNNNVPTVTNLIAGNMDSNFIYLNGNTSSWTPSTNYSPVHKKYVDDKPKSYTGYDATKTQVLKNVNGTLTWVDET